MIRQILIATLLLGTFAWAATAPSSDTAGEALKKSPRHGEWVDIPAPAGLPFKLHSWVVYPERKDKAPVVIVIHEIFGLTDWVRSVADALAAEGFIAVAPDMLSGRGPGGGNTDSFKADDVRAAIQQLKPAEVVQRLNLAGKWATEQPSANGKVATIGFCWGGSASFGYAAAQPKLNVAVVYYGRGPDAEKLANITAPVLGLYGGNDNRVTSTVEPTKKAMDELKKPYTTHIYEGAGHGFLRQQTSDENKKAAEQAWAETITFLKKNLESAP
jgi:carboxymethylenebutenolidase